MGSNFDVKDDLVLALRSQYFEYLREKNTDMPWSWCTLNRFVQKKMVSSNGNACPLLTFLKACGRWRHVFAVSASPRSCTKKLATYVTLFRCWWRSVRYQVIIPGMWHSNSYCMWHSWLTQFGLFSLNQPVAAVALPLNRRLLLSVRKRLPYALALLILIVIWRRSMQGRHGACL